jgi:hypothetical protein
VGKVVDLTGRVKNTFTVVSFAGLIRNRQDRLISSWNCVCTCGAEVVMTNNCIVSKQNKRCKCWVNKSKCEYYGSTTYKSWSMMKDRCNNTKSPVYSYYGGKGISYQEGWNKFEAFLRDMGVRPQGMTLDRIDSNGNYCRENCRWASKSVQAYNQSAKGNNKSGKSGVFKRTVKSKISWIAFIRNKGKREHLGSFPSFELAVEARKLAEIRYYGELKGN